MPNSSFGTVNTFIQWFCPCTSGLIVIARRAERAVDASLIARDGSDAMKSFANCPNIQYAIIRASGTHDSAELLVLAYSDEKSLRSLIAEPSILALGYASRSAADAAGSFLQTVASQRMHAMSAIRSTNQRFWLAFHSGRSRLTHALTYWKGYSDLYRAVQFIFATAVLVLYSRNIVSATIRTALGV
jgi:hypothetical protein